MNVHLITHNDLDGIGCAVVVKHVYDTVKVTFAGYESFSKKLDVVLKSKPDLLIISDIGIQTEDLEKIIKSGIKWEWVDHHVTSIDKILNEYKASIYVNTGFCATKNMFNWYFTGENKDNKVIKLRRFCDAVDAWDCWKLQSEHRSHGEFLNRLTYMHTDDELVNVFLNNLEPWNDEILAVMAHTAEKINKRSVNKMLQNYENQKVFTDPNGNLYRIIISTDNISECGNAALEKWPDLKYVVLINKTNGGVSFRCKKDFDVSKLASVFGGGGHAQSSGCVLSNEDTVEHYLSEYINRTLLTSRA